MWVYFDILPQELLVEICACLDVYPIFLYISDCTRLAYTKYLESIYKGWINPFNDVLFFHENRLYNRFYYLSIFSNVKFDYELLNVDLIQTFYYIYYEDTVSESVTKAIFKRKNGSYVKFEHYHNSENLISKVTVGISFNWTELWTKNITEDEKISIIKSNGYVI